MQIILTWVEHGQNFAGYYTSDFVEAHFDFLVVRTNSGNVTVPYKCMTSGSVDSKPVTALNQTGWAEAIGAINGTEADNTDPENPIPAVPAAFPSLPTAEFPPEKPEELQLNEEGDTNPEPDNG
jgi:hypothetical protein